MSSASSIITSWRDIDPAGSKNRGLLSLMRRHRHHLRPDQQLRLAAYLEKYPARELIYRFQQRLCYLLLKKHLTRRQCEVLIPRFLRALHQLRHAGLAQLVQLGQTLTSGSQEIVAMWRFTRNNGITEGFHNKMELIKALDQERGQSRINLTDKTSLGEPFDQIRGVTRTTQL